MTEKMDAQGIFDCFQTRREVLSRMGKMGVAAGLPVGLAACVEVPDNAFVDINGQRYIQIDDGLNCWGNACFTYDAASGTVAVAGRRAVPVPAAFDLSSGRISEADFEALLSRARRGGSFANGGEASGESSGGAGGGNAGGAGSDSGWND